MTISRNLFGSRFEGGFGVWRSRRGPNHPTVHNVTPARRKWGRGGGGLPVGGGVDAILAPMRTPIRYWYERSVGPDHFSWVTLRGHGSNSRYNVWLQFRSRHCLQYFLRSPRTELITFSDSVIRSIPQTRDLHRYSVTEVSLSLSTSPLSTCVSVARALHRAQAPRQQSRIRETPD